MATAESRLPSLDKPKKKKNKATRTPTELGQTTPKTKKGEKAKAKAIKAVSTDKAPVKATRAYGKTIVRVGEKKVRQRKAHARKKPDLRPVAKALSREDWEKRQLDNADEGPGKDYTLFVDKKGRVRDFEEFAPEGVRRIKAFVGDEPGSPKGSEFVSIAEMLAGGGAGAAGRAPALAKAGQKVAKAEKVAKKAQTARKVKTYDKARKSAVAEQASKGTVSLKNLRKYQRAEDAVRGAKPASRVTRAKQAAKVRYSKPERKLRRAIRTERATSHAVNPIAPAAATSDQGRAFVEGVKSANVKKSLATTARALPGLLAFPATVAADVGSSGYKAAATAGKEAGLPIRGYSGEEITGPLRGLAKETVESTFGKEGFVTKLTSGDEEQVRSVIEDDLGYFALPLVPRATRSKAAIKARDATRAGAKKVRRHRQGPRDENVFAATERKQTRKRTATTFRRKMRTEEGEGRHHQRKILKPLQNKTMRRYIDDEMGVGPGDAIGVAAEYGLSRKNPEATVARAKQRLPEESGAPPNVITDKRVFEYLDKHPELLREPRFWESVDAYKRSAEPITTSTRAKYMTQGEMAGALRPEQRTPKAARALTDAPDRKGAWADLKARQKRANAERRKGREAAIKSQEAKSPSRKEELRDVAEAHYRSAKRLDAEAKDLRSVLRRYTHPDTKASSRVRSKLWDRDLVEEYVDEVRAWARSEGFEEPAVTSQSVARYDSGEILPRYPANAAKVQHVRSGTALEADLIDRSLGALLGRSVWEPRMRKGAHDAITAFLRDERTPIVINGKRKTVVTAAEFDQAIREGQLTSKEGIRGHGGYVLIPARQFKQAVTNLERKQGEIREMATEIASELAARDKDPRSKYVIVRREAAKEFADQINPISGIIETTLNNFAKVSSRTLLATSPGWAMSQIIAEALPMAAVMTNPYRIEQVAMGLRRMNDIDPEGARAWASMAGESPIMLSQPKDMRLEFRPGMEKEALKFHQVASRNRFYRGLVSAGKLEPLGLFDRWRTGKYRKVLMTYHADKQLTQFFKGNRGLLKESKRLAEKLEGKPFHEQLAILARDEKAANRVSDYLDDIAGNWDTFTRFEREFAPALIFYPFLRYSVRFLWAFPKHHPVRAQIGYLLGQMNAEQLEKMLGAPPADWRDYANPIVHSGTSVVNGERVDEPGASGAMPMGIRIAPGMNAVSEAIGSGNFAGVSRALNPILFGAPMTAFTGVSGLSNEQEVEVGTDSILMALNQLLAMPAPARAFDVKVDDLGIGPEQEKTDIGKKFDKIDPNRKLRSVLVPPLPLSGERLAARNKLSKTVKKSGLIQSELGQVVKLAKEYGGGKITRESARKAISDFKKDRKAGDKLRKQIEGSDLPEWFLDAFYEAKYPDNGSSSSGGSSGGSSFWNNLSGGGGSSSSSSGSSSFWDNLK